MADVVSGGEGAAVADGRLRLDIGMAYLDKGHFLKAAPNAPPTGDTRYGYVDIYFEF